MLILMDDTITQSEKSSTANVNITINPVNDDPVINIASTRYRHR